MDTNKEEIKVGDVVNLRSGGGKMTVESIENGVVLCCWKDKSGSTKRESFQLSLLKKASAIRIINF
ncbi:MAG: DUF2158 domain-containing protein [Tannerella sp.]|jgi:uncharacterized protein YodC (DUF2158 family)|nr:DUF2158 domain-containing protein [Tannerella sp.]